jgi:hypothetical protein
MVPSSFVALVVGVLAVGGAKALGTDTLDPSSITLTEGGGAVSLVVVITWLSKMAMNLRDERKKVLEDLAETRRAVVVLTERLDRIIMEKHP